MRMNLAEFGREFELREMEKQAYVLKNVNLLFQLCVNLYYNRTFPLLFVGKAEMGEKET